MKTENTEDAFERNRGELFRFGTALIFIVGIMLFTIVRTDGGIDGTLMVATAMIGGCMAMNIGANDVANNVGPAVGSHAITLTGAIVIAVSFEAGGALIAGGNCWFKFSGCYESSRESVNIYTTRCQRQETT